MSSASTWADEIKSDPKYQKHSPWHYVNMPLDKEYTDIQKNPNGDIVTTLKKCIRVLKDPGSDKSDKAFYLKFLNSTIVADFILSKTFSFCIVIVINFLPFPTLMAFNSKMIIRF